MCKCVMGVIMERFGYFVFSSTRENISVQWWYSTLLFPVRAKGIILYISEMTWLFGIRRVANAEKPGCLANHKLLFPASELWNLLHDYRVIWISRSSGATDVAWELAPTPRFPAMALHAVGTSEVKLFPMQALVDFVLCKILWFTVW